MRTGVTRDTILTEVKLEARETTNATLSTTRDPYLIQVVNREYRWLAQKYRWPLRHVETNVSLTAGTKTYTFPSGMNPAFIDECWAQIGSEWYPIEHGVGIYERSVYDDTEEAWPPQRYEFQPDTGNGSFTFEVWPIPSQNGTIRFSGQQKITDLTSGGHVCLIDADVLVLRAASQILASKGQPDAAYKANQADQRARDILRNMTRGIGSTISHGRRRKDLEPWVDFIPPGT